MTNLVSRPNSELTFDGTLSTGNVGVVSYEWDFGDKTATATGSTATHAYTQEGTYTVTLTVKDAKENADTATTTVTVEATSRTVEFTTKYLATGSETAQILGNTDITIASTKENEQEILLRSDENGKATTALKPGNYIVSALCGAAKLFGYVLYVAPEEDDTAVQQEELVLTRVRSGGLEGSLTVHEMQYQEIVDAGIDITNPDNQYVYKYKAKFIYGNDGGTADPISFDYYVNSSGSCLGYSGGGGSGGGSGGDAGTGGGSTSGMAITGGWFYAPQEDIYIQPIGGDPKGNQYFLVIDGSVGFLKQIFHVELLLVNSGGTDWVENCYAEIDLPEGLSLAAMNGGSQKKRVLVNDDGKIDAGEQGVAEWFVRGDQAGEYKIKVDVDGEYYADALDVSEYAVPAMQWVCGDGVIEGDGANLNPQGQATRAEAATMLMRFCENYT